MKQLLILAYDFPPYVSVGGLRPYSWYKYLKEYGVYPIVVTRQWGNDFGDERDYIASSKSKETIVEDTEFGTIIRTPYKPNLANRILLKYGKDRFSLVRKAVSAFYEFAQFIFFIGPKSGLYYGARKYIKEHKVDAIIATGEPFVLFKYASELSKCHNIPWIADYRDPWTQDVKRSKNFFFKARNRFFEKKYVNTAKYITTVSSYFANKINILIKAHIHIIANGYDSESIEKIKEIKQLSDKLRFAYVGTIYRYHPIDSVFDGFLQTIINNNIDNFEINFYGITDQIGIEKLIDEKYPILKRHINIHPSLDNFTLLKELAKHNVLLLFNYYSIIGTKIFDYIALKRHILYCYSNDFDAEKLKLKYYGIDDNKENPQKDLIEKTNAGTIVKDKKHLICILTHLFKEFKTGKINCNTLNTSNYSRKNQVELLANLVESL